MNRPEFLKGGFVYYGPGVSEGKVLPFQYNPEVLRRTINSSGDSAQQKETIMFTFELDAADALEKGDPGVASLGLHPALAALELLIESPGRSSGLLGDLFSWLSPKKGPFVLFVWGPQRVIPVRVMEFTVSEQMFDVKLNPIRASIAMTVETLTDADLKSKPDALAFMDSYRTKKEALAGQFGALGSVENLVKQRDQGG